MQLIQEGRLKQEGLVLILLHELETLGLKEIKEHTLHMLVPKVAHIPDPHLVFITNPILYSDNLIRALHYLERKKLAYEQLRTFDGVLNMPTNFYSLTGIGRIEAEDLISRTNAGEYKIIVDAVKDME